MTHEQPWHVLRIFRLSSLGLPESLPEQITIDQALEAIYLEAITRMRSVIRAVGLPLDAEVILLRCLEDPNNDFVPSITRSILWKGFSSSARIKLFGHAGLTSLKSPSGNDHVGYAHFGGEFWSTYAMSYDNAVENEKTTSENVKMVTGYSLVSYLATEPKVILTDQKAKS